MKLKKAQVWIHNKSNRDIILSDLDLKIRSGDTVNLFAMKPSLSYDLYMRSKREGALFGKRKDLLEVDGPPRKEIYSRPAVVSDKPIMSRTKSIISGAQPNSDFFAELDDEFPRDTNLSQEDLWQAERERMLKNLDMLEQGDDGEVFSDNIFDENDEDPDGFDY